AGQPRVHHQDGAGCLRRHQRWAVPRARRAAQTRRLGARANRAVSGALDRRHDLRPMDRLPLSRPMQRRHFTFSAAALLAAPAWAHHGWSSFDQTRPIYLEGKARKVAWRNPHAEFELELPAELKLPVDLARRAVPAQSAPVDGPKLLGAAQLPKRKDKVW